MPPTTGGPTYGQGAVHRGAGPPPACLELTRLPLDALQPLVPPFEAAFHAHLAAWRLEGKPRTARRFPVDKNCPLPTPAERLCFILTDLTT